MHGSSLSCFPDCSDLPFCSLLKSDQTWQISETVAALNTDTTTMTTLLSNEKHCFNAHALHPGSQHRSDAFASEEISRPDSQISFNPSQYHDSSTVSSLSPDVILEENGVHPGILTTSSLKPWPEELSPAYRVTTPTPDLNTDAFDHQSGVFCTTNQTASPEGSASKEKSPDEPYLFITSDINQPEGVPRLPTPPSIRRLSS